jgi:hypothetical protein
MQRRKDGLTQGLLTVLEDDEDSKYVPIKMNVL